MHFNQCCTDKIGIYSLPDRSQALSLFLVMYFCFVHLWFSSAHWRSILNGSSNNSLLQFAGFHLKCPWGLLLFQLVCLELRLVTQVEKSITAKVPVNPLNIYTVTGALTGGPFQSKSCTKMYFLFSVISCYCFTALQTFGSTQVKTLLPQQLCPLS